MQRKQINLGKRILSAALAAVMSLSLAISPLPGMMADYEGEKVEAEGESTDTTTQTEDAIYLPITVRDARADYIMFEKPYDKEGEPNFQSPYLDRPGLVEDNLVNGTLKYTEYAIEALAKTGRLVNLNDINVEVLSNALKARKNASINWGTIDAAPDYSDEYKTTNKFTDIQNSRDASHWLLINIFGDATYSGTFSDNNSSDSDLYMKKVPQYESLVLQKGTKQAFNSTDYYYFNTHDQKVLYDTTKKLMRNDDSGESRGETGAGGYHPLGQAADGSYLGFEDKNSNKPSTNCCHTTTGSGQFVYHKDDNLFFGFMGDDDVFLYINDKLVIDMGGSHNDAIAYVNLESKVSDKYVFDSNKKPKEDSTYQLIPDEIIPETITKNRFTYLPSNAGDKTWAEYLGLVEGEVYSFNFFQMERRSYGSGLNMYTNIRVVNPSAVPVKKAYQNGQELAYGAYVAQKSDITYEFQLRNNGEDGSSITNMSFVDNSLGDIVLNKNTISLGSYIDASGAAQSRDVSDLEYSVYDTDSTEEPVYSKYDSSKTLEEWESEIKNALAAGIEPGETFSIRGFKYNAGTTTEYNNTLETSVTGNAINSTASVEIKGTATMRIRTTDIPSSAFVIDYGKTLDISTQEILDDKLTELGVEAAEISLQNANDNKVKGLYGTLEQNKSSQDKFLSYSLYKFMSGVDNFILNFPVTTTDESGTTSTSPFNKSLLIIPANNIYYEDDFMTNDSTGTVGITYSGAWSEVTDDVADVENNDTSDNVGTGDNDASGIPSGKDDVHGWEDALADDSKYSDGSAHTVTGGNATATFTFSGTGVDIYSRTNLSTGLVRAVLYSGGQVTNVAKKILYIDNLSESGDYYQVPTLFFENLPYAEYTVQITVGTTGGRGDYYLDGIRVYNPAGDPADNSDSQYNESEQNAKFTTLRSILLNQNSFNGSASGVKGAVFIDSTDNNNGGDGPDKEGLTELGIADYTKDGPKNEVYLASGQSIAFKVKNTAAANYYIGLRRLGTEYPAPDTPVTTDESAENESTPVVNVEYSYGATEKQSLNIQHASDLYYKAIPNKANYIVITNTSASDEIIAITKLRTTGLNNADLDLVVAKEAIAQVYALRSMPVFTNKPVDDIPAADEQIKPEDGNVNINNPELNDSTDNIIATLKGLQKLINKLFLGFGKWF